MKRFILLFLLLCFPLAYAQTISGYVHDADTDVPLEGAHVYLDGTTFSVATDAKGYFKIVTPHVFNTVMVVSSIGYEKFIVEKPYSYTAKIKVMLREEAGNVEEVVIKKSTMFSRKEMLKAFRKQFLGASAAGSSCVIENEDDIFLYYDRSTSTLHAEATKPLRIVNKRLKYKINFELADFEVAYYSPSLSDDELAGSFFAGTTFFTDFSKGGNADKRRRETYLGSTAHLMKAIYNNTWDQEKFGLYVKSFPMSPDSCFTVTDSLRYKKVTIRDLPVVDRPVFMTAPKGMPQKLADPKRDFTKTRYAILYNKKDQSSLSFNNRSFYIDDNGLFFPLTAVVFSGAMGQLKAGDMLPDDYSLKHTQ